MKLFVSILLLLSTYSFCQVGIGTATIDDATLLLLESTTQSFVPTRVSTAQMNLITTPLEGSLVYNTTSQAPFVFINGNWTELISNRTPTLLLRRTAGTFATSLTSEFQIPLNTAHAVENDASVFNINSDGKITILKSGTYTFSATLSTSNLASGSRKFYMKLYKNNLPVGILSSTSFTMPSIDFWGGGGVIMVDAAANDIFDLRYFLNENNINKNIAILSYNITKLR